LGTGENDWAGRPLGFDVVLDQCLQFQFASVVIDGLVSHCGQIEGLEMKNADDLSEKAPAIG
jgi:hypothetical protein